MSSNTFTVKTETKGAQPRSKRLREGGVYQSSGGVTVVNGTGGGESSSVGDGHTHANKAALDAISIDDDAYLYLTQKVDEEDDSTTEKVKAGYADDAAHAKESDHAVDADTWEKHSFDEYIDQPLRKGDIVGFAKVVAAIIQSSDFIPGINTGKGWQIGQSGAAELDSLTLRRFLEVPELRYNRVSIQVGNSWRAPGGGIIERVVPDYDADGNILNTGVIYLHLEDGESGLVAPDDICQGIYHDGINESANAVADLDDSIGNFRFKGFYTTYFRVTEILSSDNSSFRYAIRPVSSGWTTTHHPCAAMHFVSYGNFSDKTRQTSRYSTRTYERYLTDVASWEITESNIAAQFGDLSNLSVFGLKMTGYSGYLNNIYMSGVIRQFEALPYRVEIDTQGQDTLAYGESLEVTCKVYKGWEDKTANVVTWKIERDSGDALADAAWALLDKVKAFAGTITIEHTQEYSDLAAIGLSTLFTVTATLSDGDTTDYTLQL